MSVAQTHVPIPAHVPPELIRDFDLHHPPGTDDSGQTRDIHVLWKHVQDTYPPVFWTPRYGGHWIATRFKEVERLVMEHEKFSNRESFVPRGVFPTLIPVALDPPDHGAYRRLMVPAFAPIMLEKATTRAREVAIEIIERIKPRGHCEFVTEFAYAMPVITFLTLINLPPEDYLYLREVSHKLLPTSPTVAQGWEEMSNYVRGQINSRRAAPKEDFISSLLTAEVRGRKLTDDEVFSMCLLTVSGGLDTVMTMMTFAANYLAQCPVPRQQLAAHSVNLDTAVEEIARRFGTSNLGRIVREDIMFGDVQLRKDDMVIGIYPLAGLDENMNSDPLTLDLNRKQPRHLDFGSGVHTCIGNRLAKRELKIFLEEWFSRIPDFRLADGFEPRMSSGVINRMDELQLVWERT